MQTLQKIPFFMAAIAVIITGAICSTMQLDLNQASSRMVVVLLLFYIIGLFVKNTIKRVVEENEVKRLQTEAENFAFNEEANCEKGGIKEIPLFDVKVDDRYDDFTPLHVSEVIKSKIRE